MHKQLCNSCFFLLKLSSQSSRLGPRQLQEGGGTEGYVKRATSQPWLVMEGLLGDDLPDPGVTFLFQSAGPHSEVQLFPPELRNCDTEYPCQVFSLK